MPADRRRFVRLLAAAALPLLPLGGCRPASRPVVAGVSMELAYPVLLIGQGSLDVRDSEEDLISIRGASGLNLVERVLLASDGRLFEVVRAEPETGSKPVLLDLGTSDRRFGVVLRERPRPSLGEIQDLVLAQGRDPGSDRAGDAKAVATVRALGSVAELIEASRDAWSWNR